MTDRGNNTLSGITTQTQHRQQIWILIYILLYTITFIVVFLDIWKRRKNGFFLLKKAAKCSFELAIMRKFFFYYYFIFFGCLLSSVVLLFELDKKNVAKCAVCVHNFLFSLLCLTYSKEMKKFILFCDSKKWFFVIFIIYEYENCNKNKTPIAEDDLYCVWAFSYLVYVWYRLNINWRKKP